VVSVEIIDVCYVGVPCTNLGGDGEVDGRGSGFKVTGVMCRTSRMDDEAVV